MGGKRPQPTAVKMLHGARTSRLNFDEPQPRETEPEPPTWATEPWLEVWERVKLELVPMGMWHAADQPGLVCLVHAVFEYDRLAQLAVKAPALVRGTDGLPRPNPLGPALRQQSADVSRWCGHFAMSPAERGRISRTGAG